MIKTVNIDKIDNIEMIKIIIPNVTIFNIYYYNYNFHNSERCIVYYSCNINYFKNKIICVVVLCIIV